MSAPSLPTISEPLPRADRRRGRRLAISSHPLGMTFTMAFQDHLPTLALVWLGASEGAVGLYGGLARFAVLIKLPALRALNRVPKKTVLVAGHISALTASLPLIFFGAIAAGNRAVPLVIASLVATAAAIQMSNTVWFPLLRGYVEPARIARFFGALRSRIAPLSAGRDVVVLRAGGCPPVCDRDAATGDRLRERRGHLHDRCGIHRRARLALRLGADRGWCRPRTGPALDFHRDGRVLSRSPRPGCARCPQPVVHAVLASGYGVAETQLLFELTPPEAPAQRLVAADVIVHVISAGGPLLAGLALDALLSRTDTPLAVYHGFFTIAAVLQAASFLPLRGFARPAAR